MFFEKLIRKPIRPTLHDCSSFFTVLLSSQLDEDFVYLCGTLPYSPRFKPRVTGEVTLQKKQYVLTERFWSVRGGESRDDKRDGVYEKMVHRYIN